ncbi:MAG: putative zinc-binding peptidase [Vicinamibacteraceae bacterium]
MRIFHCDHCDHLIFFENHSCVSCGRQLAYLPDIAEIGSLDPGVAGTWVSPIPGASPAGYRLCANYTTHNVCNWAIPADDPDALCSSCRLTRAIPDPSMQWQRQAWYKLEVAKRRVVYSLLQLRLPVANRVDDPVHGLAFQFLADQPQATGPVLTGHLDGVVTINLAEADDAERERRRLQLHEPYRTLLGHVRHEVGHYYWERLIAGTRLLGPFRALFGDERIDYGAALQAHYQNGPPADWQDRFVTTYAASHPWEDWAETWAHYLHLTDTLETAAACGVSITPGRSDEPALPRVPATAGSPGAAFDRLMVSWFPLTYVLNNLNRGLGVPDAYPFVLSQPAIEKLRFVHDVIVAAAAASTTAAQPPRRATAAGGGLPSFPPGPPAPRR